MEFGVSKTVWMMTKASLASKIYFAVFSLLVGTLVLIGVSSIKKPDEMRLVRTDQRRISDLNRMAEEIILFYEKNELLPNAVSGLDTIQNASDPISSEPYQYRALEGAAFELCATFDTSNLTSERSVFQYVRGKPYDWRHPAGHYCFKIDNSKAD